MHRSYTDEDDDLLTKYIATYNPQIKGRLGMKIYERLVENAEQKWPFSSRHSVQSWREHYKKNQLRFDAQILEYQKKHDISADALGDSLSKVRSGVRKTPPADWRSRTDIPSSSTTPIGENGAKKRRREVDSEDPNLDSGAAKKLGEETVSVQGSQLYNSPPPTRSPSVELRNGGKAPEDSLPLLCTGADKAAAAIGHGVHAGALSDSGGPSVQDPFCMPLVNREARRWTLAGDSTILRVDACKDDRRASVQHIDLRALHSRKSVGPSLIRSSTSVNSSVAKKKVRRKPPRSSTPPNLSESNKELVLALGLDVVYSRMVRNHKFNIDIVREVAAKQQSLEDADRVLYNMRDAAGQARARRLALKISTASPNPSPMRPPKYSPPTPTRAHVFRRLEREGRIEEARLREARRARQSLWPSNAEASSDADDDDDDDDDSHTLSDLQAILHVDSMRVDDGLIATNGHQTPLGHALTEEIRHNGFPLERECATSSFASSALPTLSEQDAEWSNSDDELLLDGDLIAHGELLRRKGLSSVKFRTTHLYCLLLDGCG